jgi:hypothetical protein
MGQMARFQETLRRLAMIDESLVEDQAGLGWVVAAAPEVATALGYDGMLLDVRPGRMRRRQQGVFSAAPSSVSR